MAHATASTAAAAAAPKEGADEVKIVGIVCNWCSYAGADGAGTARLKQPLNLRLLRVPCTGRIDPLFALKAFEKGADAVLISGCHPGDCHYSEGNYYARRKFELLDRMLPHLGVEPDRFKYTWVSASEGARWQKVVTDFVNQVKALGPRQGKAL
jgi:F420-non-reducing hydrogenase iron-sulfur subunit